VNVWVFFEQIIRTIPKKDDFHGDQLGVRGLKEHNGLFNLTYPTNYTSNRVFQELVI